MSASDPRLSVSATPRTRAIGDLTARVAEAPVAGDLTLARLLTRALGELLADPEADPGDVVDLGAHRKSRKP